jgi:tetratricopeptide (TPR) repeat protein/DNA-binding CsgD family transcriptional regulator
MKKAFPVFWLFALISCLFTSNGGYGNASGELPAYRPILDSARAISEDQPENSILLIREALRQLDEQDDAAAASTAYYLLGEAYYYMDNLDLSILNYQKALDINVRNGLDKTPEHITLLGNLGFNHDARDEKVIAMGYYEQALSIAREIGKTDEIAANLANIGQLKTLMGDYKNALVYMEEALELDRQLGDETVIAVDLNIIGRIYESWGMFDKAVIYLEQALEINRRLNQEEQIAIRYNSLGLVYKGWGKYPIALDYFEKALAIDKKLRNPDKVALRQANIGSTYLEMGEPEKAIPFLEQGLVYFEKNGMPSYNATILNDLGRAYMLQKESANAEAAFLRSIEFSRKEKMNVFLKNSLENLSRLYRQTGQFPKAYDALSEAVRLRDSIFNIESQKKLAEFQTIYDLELKQQENEILRRDKELSEERHTVTILIFSTAGLFLGMLLLALLFLLKSYKTKRLLAEKENERLRQDLEQRNKELTYNAMCIIKNNETVARMVEVVEDALRSGQNQDHLRNIVYQLQHMESDNNWKDFEVHFIQTHKDFYDNLQKQFPELTPNEKKLCAFLRLNMSTKDIASITHQSVHSINVARTRLRKKLGIGGTDENLVNFLASL